MIPYYPQPAWQAGPLTIHAFGIAAALAVLAGYVTIVRRARAEGLDNGLTGRMAIWGALAGLVGGHLAAVLQHGVPWFVPWRGQSLWGLAAGSLAVAGYYFWRYRRLALLHLDVLALAFPVSWALVRLGCFFAHDHIGRPSQSFLAVRFPEGSRFDLGLIECLAAIAVGLLLWFVVAPRRGQRPGLLFGFLLVAAGLTRLGIRALAGD